MRLAHSHHEWIFGAGLLLLLSLLAAVAAVPVLEQVEEVPVRIEPVSGPGAAESLGRNTLVLPGAQSGSTLARLHFELPAPDPDSARWVVLVPRAPLDALAFRAPGWSTQPRDFFQPTRAVDDRPMSYIVPLPQAMQGAVVVEMEVRAALRSAVKPQVVREGSAWWLHQRAMATVMAVYASLFTLALLGLALYSAARDRTFLAFFGFNAAALLMLGAVNGHLYMLPVLDVLALWREQGVWCLCVLFVAALLQLLMRYAGTDHARPREARWIDRYCLGLLGVAAVFLLNLDVVGRIAQAIGMLAWLCGAGIGVAILFDAGRRQVRMAWINLLLLVLALLAALASEVTMHGLLAGGLLTRYGYEIALAASATLLAVGLIDRIAEFRDQHERERQERAQTERRMQREAARTAYASALQKRLRGLAGADIPAIALRLMLDNLAPLVPAQLSLAAVHAWHGRDAQVVEPGAMQSVARTLLETRGLLLRRQVGNGTPMQQVVALDGAQAHELVVPLPIRAPGWGLLVLQRSGEAVFTAEDIALVGEFARLAVHQADQEVAAAQLRRTAEVDALTGSVNRRTIDQMLARSFGAAHRENTPLSVLFVDLDHFKAINDTHGHACGDECLRAVAIALRGALEPDDVVGRYGGEEFVAILPGRAGAAARVMAERLRSAVEGLLVDFNGQAIRFTVSIGLATRLQDEKTPEATLARADKALYAAKRSGRNCVQVAPAVFS